MFVIANRSIDIKVEGTFKHEQPNEKGKYFVQVSVDDIKPTESADAKFISSPLSWEWNNQEM